MKVCMVLDKVGGGGGEVFVNESREFLEERGHETILISSDMGEIDGGFSDGGMASRIVSSVKAKVWNIPRVIDKQDLDLVVSLSPLSSVALGSKADVYAPRFLSIGHRSGIMGWFKEQVEKRALSYDYSLIIALGENMKRRIEEERSDVQVEIVPIGIDTDKFSPDSEIDKDVDILFVGRFVEEKNVHMFLRLARESPELQFGMCGGKEEDLDEDVPSNVKCFGYLPHDKMPMIYNRSKCLVLPSITEALPRTLMESLSCGTPAVSSDVGCVSDIILDGETGWLFRKGNYHQMKEATTSIIDNMREKFSKKGRQHILENFRKEDCLEDFVGILEGLQ